MVRSIKQSLTGAPIGHICDACNTTIRKGDRVRAYATRADNEKEWQLRRVWCHDCGCSSIADGTAGTDEVLVSAIFWNHRLLSVHIVQRSLP